MFIGAVADIHGNFEALIQAMARHPDVPGPRQHFLRRWWRYRTIHRLFGWKFWAFVVGAAPLDSELEALWSELGYVVVQGYGLTETAPIVSLNHPFSTRKGSVGKAMAGVEVKLAPDGEILVRGEKPIGDTGIDPLAGMPLEAMTGRLTLRASEKLATDTIEKFVRG